MKTPRTSTFVTRLYNLLEEEMYRHVVEWCQNGEHFIIKDLKAFKDHLLSNYFANVNYPSFARQLKMYGFSQVSDARTQKQPSGQRWFRHPSFKRGHQEQLCHVRRVSVTRPAETKSTATSPTELKSYKFCLRGMNTPAYWFLHSCPITNLQSSPPQRASHKFILFPRAPSPFHPRFNLT
ncbi:kinase-regulated stress-responsive transcription factor skn7, variant 2 [Entomophthora muscae]|uniref:Kinase-regulated stress-responsive transcription factor skn7, variant 2 n=2 Tax=Entomophthora muscae TaxID=34485 RepID=A0ACC2UJ72_9FUNG|nr:kinase-regulated stress-responsive transcription factor skn7, variant 2 [Entomophthora muscae]